MTKDELDAQISCLTVIQQKAIKRSIFLAGSWGLSDWNEDHVDITEYLPEKIADPVSGKLTKLGNRMRLRLAGEPK